MVHSEAGVLLTIIMGAGGASPPHLRLMYGLQWRLEHALYSLHLLPVRMLLQMHRYVLSANRVNQPVHQPLKVGTLNCQNQSPKCVCSSMTFIPDVPLTYVCIQSSNLQNQS